MQRLAGPAQPVRRADQRGGVKTGQHLAPGRVGGVEVSIGQPGDKPAIRRGRRQPLPVIAGEYFPQQDRHRPAIEHDVVISQHKPVPICARCGSTPPERPAGGPGRRPRPARRRTPAGSAHRHRPLDTAASSSTYRQGATGSAGMICTGSSNCAQNRAARLGCRLTTVCTASRSRSRVERRRSP